MHFSRVLPQVLVGSCPQTAEDVHVLAAGLTVTAVLSLQTDEDLPYDHQQWLAIQELYRRLSIRLCRVPVRDFDSADLRARLPECVRTLNELLRQGHTVYVHCTAGMNRSPSVVVAWLHWMQPCELETALRQVTSCHSCLPDREAICGAGEDLVEA
jgi:protein-tyrosine phosphatase